jgi:hypothetical protein
VLNPICHLLALFVPHHILHVSRIWVMKSLAYCLYGPTGQSSYKVYTTSAYRCGTAQPVRTTCGLDTRHKKVQCRLLQKHIAVYTGTGKKISCSFYAVKAYMASGGIAPLILNPRYWMQVRGKHHSPAALSPGKDLQYPPNTRLGWPHNNYRRFGKYFPGWNSNPGSSSP